MVGSTTKKKNIVRDSLFAARRSATSSMQCTGRRAVRPAPDRALIGGKCVHLGTGFVNDDFVICPPPDAFQCVDARRS
jgi:hypothetical protein